MLHLHFALDYENLADTMIGNVRNHWASPFASPTVIFPDRNLEQWFRLRWIAKEGVIANLRTRTIDDFLFEILAGKDAENGKTVRLPVEFLRNAMIAWLSKEQSDGRMGYQTLHSDRVQKYLEADSSGTIDQNRLFDFATIMSGLFLEYETTRPGNFNTKCADGLLERWKPESYRPFFDDAQSEDAWQYKLYSAMFHGRDGKPSLLDMLSEADGVRYRTIAQLYAQRRDANHGTEFFADKTPVFLFWHAGMGQTYRVILEDFAHHHDVFAFVQNPCMEFWEDVTCFPEKMRRRWDQSHCPDELHKDFLFEEKEPDTQNENTLLKKWGRAGRDNIRLWCMASQYDFQFAEEDKETPADASLLAQVQSMVAHRTDEFQNGYKAIENGGMVFSQDPSLSVTAAPSRIREIEALHTRICKLLQNGDARLNDILVMAPDIAAYRSAIYQIFDQTAPDDKHHLRIPFTIVGTETVDSMTASALRTLCAIHRKGTLTRPAFFELVRNPVVQSVRGIKPEYVESWENWVDAMHIYRDRDARQEDWMDGVRRMIAARFADCTVTNGELSYTPYADIDAGDAAMLCAFIECIEDLQAWIGLKSPHTSNREKSIVTKEILDRVMDVVRSWLALPDVPKGMGCEFYVYQSIMGAFDTLGAMFRAGIDGLEWECVYQTLRHSASETKLRGGMLFAHGITFMQFQAARIVPVKYLFFIGADEMKFPGSSQTRSLDLRQKERKWPGDTQPADRNRYGFLCQLMCTGEQFHISYVNKDLQKDKDYYPSSPIHDIRDMLRNAMLGNREEGASVERGRIWPVAEIPLDETRDWEELYTQRAIRNKEAFLKMIAAKADQNHDSSEAGATQKANCVDASARGGTCGSGACHPVERVSLYQIREFLEDPFQLYISRILCEEEEDVTDVSYEPISLGHLENSQALKACVRYHLENEGGCASKGLEEEDKGKRDAFFAECQRNGHFPDGIYGDITLDNLWDKAQDIAKQMTDVLKIDKSKFVFDDKTAVEIPPKDFQNGKSWTLQGMREWHSHEGENSISVYRVVEKKKEKEKDFISLYVTALSLLAELQENTETIRTINMRIIWPLSSLEKEFKMSPDDAREILQCIYTRAFVQDTHQCIPVEWVLDKHESFESFADFESKLTDDHGPWKYFDKKDLFDLRKSVGYHSDHRFPKEWEDARKTQNELFWKEEK